MRGPSLAGKAEPVGEEEDTILDRQEAVSERWTNVHRHETSEASQAAYSHHHRPAVDMSYASSSEQNYYDGLTPEAAHAAYSDQQRPAVDLSYASSEQNYYYEGAQEESDSASENEKRVDALRKELSLAIGGKRKLEASEQKWKEEAHQSVVVGEEMKLLVVELLGVLDSATVESKELRKEVARLKKENTRLDNKSVSADIRAECAETRLEELKEASRAAIKRNESLTAQIEACRVSMQTFRADRKEKRALVKEVADERQRGDAAEKLVAVLRNDKQELEAARTAMLRELDRASKREDKFQEAVVAHCTLANELREHVQKLEAELQGRHRESSSEERELWREHAAALARHGVAREASMREVVRTLLGRLAQSAAGKVMLVYGFCL
jgi:hypothetical protein